VTHKGENASVIIKQIQFLSHYVQKPQTSAQLVT